MRKYSSLLAALSVGLLTNACEKPPAFGHPPESEYSVARFELANGASTDTVSGASISQDFLRTIGIRPALGRLFIVEDFQPAGPATAVISYDLWQRRFGSAPTVIGQTIRLNGKDAVVVGVTPKQVEFPPGAAVWVTRR